MTAGDELSQEVTALLRQADKSPGERITAIVRMVQRSLYIFSRNAAQLQARIEFEQGQEAWIQMNQGGQAELERHLDEVDRLLHNFLAATYTLSTYTMNFRNEQSDVGLNDEYSRRSPFGDPVCQLVKELRRKAQHASLPVLAYEERVVVNPPEWSIRLVVNRKYLSTLSLNKSTRDYVATFPRDPSLGDLIESYARHVEQFSAWFVGAVLQLRSADLAATDALRQRARDVLRQAREQPPDGPDNLGSHPG